MKLDDLDFADDLALLSHMQQQMQEKTTSVAVAVGINIHKGKSKILKYNTACTNQITLDRDLEAAKTFTYLGNIIDEHSGSDANVKARIGKSRAVYPKLKKIWNSEQLSTPKSEFSIQMSKQFYCIGQKPGELRKPSSRRYRCLLTVVYAKYFRSVGRKLLATTNCGKEQTRSQRRRKSRRIAGSR
ncbi:unnamed protein product [Schistosoma margrebowiei]|uniref:Uncharacterized protein n=1 Tax=Schistosoma margrebowiei TaxID=48269 RepID=A0A183MUN9_9TREM|nr:unnamed protein product [Schistosoma margrebowiei]